VTLGRGDQVDTNFIRGAPTKFESAKNVRNSAQFLTTFAFDREYLRNGSTYLKSEKYLINYISSPIRWKKIGELWSTNQKVIDAHVDPPNWTFFAEYYISAPRPCWTLKFLHTADIGQGLLAHTRNRVGDPPKKFKGEHLKLGLKFYIWAAYRFGGSGLNLTKLYQGRWLEDWMIKWTLILQGVPPTKFGRAKMSRIRRDFW